MLFISGIRIDATRHHKNPVGAYHNPMVQMRRERLIPTPPWCTVRMVGIPRHPIGTHRRARGLLFIPPTTCGLPGRSSPCMAIIPRT